MNSSISLVLLAWPVARGTVHAWDQRNHEKSLFVNKSIETQEQHLKL